jgi:hypothetical protein
MKKFVYLAAVMLLCGKYLFGQTDKKEYIQQWVDSLNSRNSDVWINPSPKQADVLLRLPIDSIDLAFAKFSEYMLEQEKLVVIKVFYFAVFSLSSLVPQF